MGEVVNLNQARKRKQRLEKQKHAAINRKKYGRNRAEKQQDSSLREKQENTLDGNRVDDPE